jgi:hypothetical protein
MRCRFNSRQENAAGRARGESETTAGLNTAKVFSLQGFKKKPDQEPEIRRVLFVPVNCVDALAFCVRYIIGFPLPGADPCSGGLLQLRGVPLGNRKYDLE